MYVSNTHVYFEASACLSLTYLPLKTLATKPWQSRVRTQWRLRSRNAVFEQLNMKTCWILEDSSTRKRKIYDVVVWTDSLRKFVKIYFDIEAQTGDDHLVCVGPQSGVGMKRELALVEVDGETLEEAVAECHEHERCNIKRALLWMRRNFAVVYGKHNTFVGKVWYVQTGRNASLCIDQFKKMRGAKRRMKELQSVYF